MRSPTILATFSALLQRPSRSRTGLLRVPRSADEHPCTQRVPSPRHGPMATLAQAAKSTGPDHLGTDSEVGRRLSPETPHPSSLASCAVCRQSPEVGAECLNGARSDLYGGHSPMSVPTAIIRFGLRGLRAFLMMGYLSALLSRRPVTP